MRKHENGFYVVDSSKLANYHDEPFVLPKHCEQVFFYKDVDGSDWWQVVHIKPRRRPYFDGGHEAPIEHGDIEASQSIINENLFNEITEEHATAPVMEQTHDMVELEEEDAALREEEETIQECDVDDNMADDENDEAIEAYNDLAEMEREELGLDDNEDI